MVDVLMLAHHLILQILLKINVIPFVQVTNLQIQQRECALIFVLMDILVKTIQTSLSGKDVFKSVQKLHNLEILYKESVF